jgi:hypothetical protein
MRIKISKAWRVKINSYGHFIIEKKSGQNWRPEYWYTRYDDAIKKILRLELGNRNITSWEKLNTDLKEIEENLIAVFKENQITNEQ